MTTDAVVDAIDEFSRSVQENVSDENDILLELAQIRRQRVSSPIALPWEAPDCDAPW
jgi:hypothetical protein